MTINEIQDQIIEDFSFFDDWMEKYEYIIDLGKKLPLIREEYKVDENLIRGCQSRVWLHADVADGKVRFTADSDAVITKGIIGLLIQVLDNQSAEDIAKSELYFPIKWACEYGEADEDVWAGFE